MMSALGVDKADLSRLLTLANALPIELIQAIGPAPKIGRPRWHQLAELLNTAATRKHAMAIVAERDFGNADTNQRFTILMRSLRQPAQKPGSGQAKNIRTKNGNCLLASTTQAVICDCTSTTQNSRLSYCPGSPTSCRNSSRRKPPGRLDPRHDQQTAFRGPK